MSDPLPITIRTFGLCQECGAVVHDEAKHFEWHADQLPDDLPEQVSDPWEEALEGVPTERRGWDWHLGNALRMAATALQGGHDPDYHLTALACTAAHVRAMAPEGTQWEEPWQVKQGTERNVLRSVIRSLANADNKRGNSSSEEAAGWLATADAYLHGLWLAAQEG